MNKKLSKWLLLPLGVSLLLPGVVANAADAAKTTADFKDLANVDAALKAKIDALLSKGVFNGVSDDSFGIDENMTRAQFAKVLTLIYGVNVDNSLTQSSFSDVGSGPNTSGWAISYIEAAKKAGLLNGRTDGTFDPGADVTMGEFATALVRGLGVQPDTAGSPWYADAIKKAIGSGLIPEGTFGKQLTTRSDLVTTSFDVVTHYDDIKKQLDEMINGQNNNNTEDGEDENTTPSTGGTIIYPSDTTAPSITAATINSKSVTVTGGATGAISFKSSEYLTGGTLSVSEASALTITSIEGITLSDYSTLSFTQNLNAGSNFLDLISTLGALDPQHDGVSVSKLSQLDSNHDGLVVNGTLSDSSGNSRAVQLTIKADDTAPSLTAATINGSNVTLSGNSGSFSLAPDAKLQSGTITANENAAFRLTAVQGVDLTGYSFNFTQQVMAGTAASLNLASFLGASDPQGDGLSVSQLKLLSGASSSLVITGTLTDEAGNSSTVTLTLNFS